MGKIFLGFAGKGIEQAEKRLRIKDSFECWNLKKMGFIEFVVEIKKEIKPVNKNVTDDSYVKGFLRNKNTKAEIPMIYDRCSWGLLLPHKENRDYVQEERLEFLLNLYSPEFLYPLFVVSDLGIEDKTFHLPRFWLDQDHTQNQSKIFSTEQFVDFYKKLLPQSRLFASDTKDIDRWSSEMALIGMACHLFNDLKKYHTKTPVTYHSEYLDICVILETMLLMEYEEKKKNIAWRSLMLLSSTFPDARGLFSKIYDERSKFVHGKTFKAMKKYSLERQHSGATIAYNKMHFDLSEKATKYLRYLLAAYVYLHKVKKGDTFQSIAKNIVKFSSIVSTKNLS